MTHPVLRDWLRNDRQKRSSAALATSTVRAGEGSTVRVSLAPASERDLKYWRVVQQNPEQHAVAINRADVEFSVRRALKQLLAPAENVIQCIHDSSA